MLTLLLLLILLIAISAFFSGSETGMMALNRYRIRHLAKRGKAGAQRVVRLLKRPDRLLGVILIGNTFANILASSIATIMAVSYFGDMGAILATVVLTLVILIFAETAPKTLAALYPERVAIPASWILSILLKICYPLVWLVNGLANGLLRLFGVKLKSRVTEPLSADELRMLVHEASGKISHSYQQMLLRILDLEHVTVASVMVPRNEIKGINISDDWNSVVHFLTHCDHAYVPVYRDNIDSVLGMLNLRKILSELQRQTLKKEDLIQLAEAVYFVPEAALLNRQLLNFQEQQQSVGIVVDEYGDIQGLVTLQDILEEIVGEFAAGIEVIQRFVTPQPDGSVLVDARISMRELNRMTGWHLPTDGPKTLSGLITEYLELMPQAGIGARIAGYPMEIVKVSGKMVRQVRVWPILYKGNQQ